MNSRLNLIRYFCRLLRPVAAGLGMVLFITSLQLSPVRAEDTATTIPKPIDNAKTTALCGPANRAPLDRGREMLLLDELAKNEQLYRYSVAASYAANCINRMVDYVHSVQDGIDKIMLVSKAVMAGQGDPASIAAAALVVVATEILNAVLKQIMQQLTNQICNITTELVQAMDSVVKNAICLPQIDIPGLSSLGFTANINLGRTTCDGWSINPAGFIGQTSQVPDSVGGSAMTAPVVNGLPIAGIGGLSYSGVLPPQYRSNSGGGGDDGLWMDYVAGTEDIVDNADTDTALSNNPGNSKLNIAAAIARLNSAALAASAGDCAKYVRLALEAGGINTSIHPIAAADYGLYLTNWGFNAVANQNTASSYVPQVGDIVVFDRVPGHPYGHIAMWNGSNWVSDFKQRSIIVSGAYLNGGFTIYRP